eukprot:PhF_6_TR8659/c0_g1_i2/m.13537/K18776/MTR2, MT48; cap2 methyltransferase
MSFVFQESELKCYGGPRVPLILSDDTPQVEYSRDRGAPMTHVHWGQRKLLLSEIEFLLYSMPRGSPPRVHVVYAGAAPGSHMTVLSNMFMNTTYELYDPCPFDPALQEDSRFELHTGEDGYFSDRVAHNIVAKRVHDINLPALSFMYSVMECETANFSQPIALLAHAALDCNAPPLLFVSDIRSGKEKNDDFDSHVEQDMDAQVRWHRILRPQSSMLKFRLPYAFTFDQHTKTLVPNPQRMVPYLDGDIYLPIWGRHSTTECRLVSKGYASMKPYDIQKYDSQLIWVNK